LLLLLLLLLLVRLQCAEARTHGAADERTPWTCRRPRRCACGRARTDAAQPRESIFGFLRFGQRHRLRAHPDLLDELL
jgi:hypothetical protein